MLSTVDSNTARLVGLVVVFVYLAYMFDTVPALPTMPALPAPPPMPALPAPPPMSVSIAVLLALIVYVGYRTDRLPDPSMLSSVNATTRLGLLVGVFCCLTFTLDHTHWNGIDEEETIEKRLENRLYYVMTTMSTVGYGDISPKSSEARLITSGMMVYLVWELDSYLKNKGA